jgi:DNA-binding NtrC family response regulator
MQVIQTPIQNILLIDDDIDDCDVFGQALQLVSNSLQLSYIHQSEAVLTAIAAFQPDLIFLDINLPRISGFDCLNEIQKSGKFANIPIIMYSSSDNPKEVHAAYGLGATLYFRKPSNFTQLVQSLKDIIAMTWESPTAIKAQYYRNNQYFPYQAEAL